MIILYSSDPIRLLNLSKRSLFLAGPTPRSKDVLSWRPKAIEILGNLKFDGTILVPEWSPYIPRPENFDYLNQVEWEHEGLEHCSHVVLWVPRNMKTMPALTTNVEFGLYVKSGRAIYGRPDDAEHCRYLDWLYAKYNWKPIQKTLPDLMELAITV